jgi:hypothetical protein
MKLATSGSGASRAPKVKPGTHVGVLAAVVDVGLQPGTAAYPAPKRKLWLAWEFPAITVEFEKDGEKKSYKAQLWRSFSASLNAKATLRKIIESMRGAPFASDGEAATFDPFTLIGINCMVPVSHKQVGDTTYANWGNPVPMPEGMPVLTLSGPALKFDTDARNDADYSKLPEWLRKQIDNPAKLGAIMPGPAAQDVAPVTGGLPDLPAE